MDNRDYYRFISYSDGSGKAYGLVIKSFTEEEAKHRKQSGYIYMKMEDWQKINSEDRRMGRYFW